eukprot:COSAG01_NODE_64053_length_278_cov_0.564246_1_plen_26_part_01
MLPSLVARVAAHGIAVMALPRVVFRQ